MQERVHVRMDADVKIKGEEQASKLGLNLSEYLRLIIALDSATGLIDKLKASK